MKFTTRLLLLTVLSLILATASWWGINWHQEQQRHHAQRLDTITRLLLEVDSMRSLIRAYSIYSDQVTADQWTAKQELIPPLLERLNSSAAPQQALVNSIAALTQSNQLLFKRLRTNDKYRSDNPLHPQAHNELVSRIHNTLQGITNEALRLSQYSQQYASERSELVFFIIKILLSGSALMLTAIALAGAIRFRARIRALNGAMVQLSQGDLSTRIQPPDDEFGPLADYLNRMADKLQRSTVKREQLELEVARQTHTLEQQKNSLKHQAEHDPLTRLPNRVLFLESLQQAIERAKRNRNRIAILFIDLDDFKLINDGLGHQTGDWALKEITRRFASATRSNDLIARLGGDEFIVMQEPIQSSRDAYQLAQKLIGALQRPLMYQENPFYLHASIGISLYPDNADSAAGLIRHADIAMYKAKEQGGNSFQYYTESMTQTALNLMEQEAEIRRGLANDEFDLFFQPQFILSTGQLCGIEALVRWHHPSRGVLPATDFIRAAEDSGLVAPLGKKVLSIACRAAQQWRSQGINPGMLSINISGKQIHNHHLITSVGSILSDSGWPARQLQLEVKEEFLISEGKEAFNSLNQLRSLECSLAIDHFGTGYCSLNDIRQLPVRRLKIDRRYIAGMTQDDHARDLVKAAIALGQALGLEVIAAGVENEEQARLLRELNCPQAQGFLFAHPMDAGSFLAWMSDYLHRTKLQSL